MPKTILALALTLASVAAVAGCAVDAPDDGGTQESSAAVTSGTPDTPIDTTPSPVDLTKAERESYACWAKCTATRKSGRWCTAYCDCMRQTNKDRWTCERENPYVDL